MKTWIKEEPSMPLFDAIPTTDDRKAKARSAYNASSSAWKEAVYSFAVGIFLVDKTDLFIFEELTHAYEAYADLYYKPKTIEKRAFAGLQQRLLKEGRIVRTNEVGRSYEGNIRPKYRSVNVENSN